MIEVVERNYGGRDTRGWFRMVHSALDARGCPTEVDVAGFRRLDASGQPTGRAGFEHLGSSGGSQERRGAPNRLGRLAQRSQKSASQLFAVGEAGFHGGRPAFLQHQPCNFDPHLPHCFRRRLPGLHAEDAAELPRRASRRRRAAPPKDPRAGAPQNNRLTFFFPFSVFRVILRLVRTSAAGRGGKENGQGYGNDLPGRLRRSSTPAPGRAAAATPVIAIAIEEKYPNSGQAIEKYEFQIWILLRLIWKSLRLIWKSLRLAWILSAPIWNSDRRGRPPVME